MVEVVTDSTSMMDATAVVTWEDLEVVEETLVDAEILVLPGVWVVLA